MLTEARDAKAGLEEELAQSRHAVEGMTSPRTRDAAKRQFQEETTDLEGRLRATDKVRMAAEARLLEQELESKRKGLRYNRRRAPGGARGPCAAANDLDY